MICLGKRRTICLVAGGLLLRAAPAAPGAPFVYGAAIDRYNTGTWVDRDSLASLKLNTVLTWATRAHPDWSIHVDSLARRGMAVWAANSMSDLLPPEERGLILRTLHRKSPARAIYSVWPAGDTTAFGRPARLGLRHPLGRPTASGWSVVEGRDTAGCVQDGPGLYLGGGSPVAPTVTFVEYCLRWRGPPDARPETPVCRLYGLHDKWQCQYADNPLYDSVLRAADFPSGGDWKRVLFRFELAHPYLDLVPDCDHSVSTAASLRFAIDWFGRGELELAWTRAMDTNGWELVLGPEELRRGPIKRLAGRFRDAAVTAWFGDESGWGIPSRTGAYFFVDSLVRDTTGGRAGAFVDLGLANVEPRSAWEHYIHAALRAGGRDFVTWYTPFSDRPEWSRRTDSLQAHTYLPMRRRIQELLAPWLDTLPDVRWIPMVQTWSDNRAPGPEVSPTPNDVVCQTFFYLAHGARGIIFYRYDGGVWSTGRAGWGLTYGGDSGLVYSPRYAAVRDRISPLLVDAGWASLLVKLEHLGGGAADTVDRIGGSFLLAVASDRRPAFLEAGFWRDPEGADRYVMLVNRRTLDARPQDLTLLFDPGRLDRRAGAYAVTDLGTGRTRTVSLRENRLERYLIPPGDPLFLRVSPLY